MESLAPSLLDYIKGAYAGPNVGIYIGLNILALFAHRQARFSTEKIFTWVAGFGGFMGALGAYNTTLAEVGMAVTVLMHAVLVGLITGASSSVLVGYGISAGAAKLGLAPISFEKIHAERLRDPLDPTMPTDTVVKETPKETP